MNANSQKMGLVFSCEICEGKVCLMCNHTLHNDHPDHALKTYYILKTCNIHLVFLSREQS